VEIEGFVLIAESSSNFFTGFGRQEKITRFIYDHTYVARIKGLCYTCRFKNVATVSPNFQFLDPGRSSFGISDQHYYQNGTVSQLRSVLQACCKHGRLLQHQ